MAPKVSKTIGNREPDSLVDQANTLILAQQRSFKIVSKHLAAITHGRCDQDDILSEMNMSALIAARRGLLLKVESLKPYVAKAAYNGAIDWIRSRRCQYSYNGKFVHVSLQGLARAGIDFDLDGHPYNSIALAKTKKGGEHGISSD